MPMALAIWLHRNRQVAASCGLDLTVFHGSWSLKYLLPALASPIISRSPSLNLKFSVTGNPFRQLLQLFFQVMVSIIPDPGWGISPRRSGG